MWGLLLPGGVCYVIWPRRKFGYPFNANQAVMKQDLHAIQGALENYASEHAGSYPTSLAPLLAPSEGEAGYLFGRATLCSSPIRRARPCAASRPAVR